MAEIDVKKQDNILQKQSLGRVLQESCSKIFGKAYRKTHVKEPFFLKNLSMKACNFIQKETHA